MSLRLALLTRGSGCVLGGEHRPREPWQPAGPRTRPPREAWIGRQRDVLWPPLRPPSPNGQLHAPQWSATRSRPPGRPHWRAVERGCPHCECPEETVEHQLWRCPRWAAIRQAQAARFGFDLDALVRTLGPLTLHALLRPPCPFRAAAALPEVGLRLPALAPLALAADEEEWETAWIDGAGSEAASCGLARVAWAYHFGEGGRAQAGQVPGAQSVQRAELYAAVMAATAARCRLLVVTDSQYVAHGIGRIPGRLRPPEGQHADLWAVLWAAARGGGLRARWVPAHRPAPDPPLLSELDWHGNGEADRLAAGALVRLRPDPELRAAAMQAEQLYAAAVAVGSAALEAQLAWAHT